MKQPINKNDFTVKVLFKETKKILKLKLLTKNVDLTRVIVEEHLHRPGLALAGFVDVFTFQRIQVFGNTELSFLNKMNKTQQEKSLEKLFSFVIPCIIAVDAGTIPQMLIDSAEKHLIPVIASRLPTTKVFQILGYYLEEEFAPELSVHGCLVDVYGIGILITGRSGIGKSELALDLIKRGHRLICDDVVKINRMTSGILIGRSNKHLKYRMEIRGIGIIDVNSMFGIRAIRSNKRIEVELKLIDWDKSQKYERLGLDEKKSEILGEKIPVVHLPIFPGKTISVFAEVVALNELLKLHGENSAKQFSKELTRRIEKKSFLYRQYLGPDFE